MVMSTTTRWVTSVGVAIAIAAPMVGAQSRKPRVVIVATGGTIAGAAESTTAAGYKSGAVAVDVLIAAVPQIDRKSTRLNSSHSQISYAVFCLKKKNKKKKHSHNYNKMNTTQQRNTDERLD